MLRQCRLLGQANSLVRFGCVALLAIGKDALCGRFRVVQVVHFISFCDAIRARLAPR